VRQTLELALSQAEVSTLVAVTAAIADSIHSASASFDTACGHKDEGLWTILRNSVVGEDTSEERDRQGSSQRVREACALLRIALVRAAALQIVGRLTGLFSPRAIHGLFVVSAQTIENVDRSIAGCAVVDVLRTFLEHELMESEHEVIVDDEPVVNQSRTTECAPKHVAEIALALSTLTAQGWWRPGAVHAVTQGTRLIQQILCPTKRNDGIPQPWNAEEVADNDVGVVLTSLWKVLRRFFQIASTNAHAPPLDDGTHGWAKIRSVVGLKRTASISEVPEEPKTPKKKKHEDRPLQRLFSVFLSLHLTNEAGDDAPHVEGPRSSWLLPALAASRMLEQAMHLSSEDALRPFLVMTRTNDTPVRTNSPVSPVGSTIASDSFFELIAFANWLQSEGTHCDVECRNAADIICAVACAILKSPAARSIFQKAASDEAISCSTTVTQRSVTTPGASSKRPSAPKWKSLPTESLPIVRCCMTC